MPPTSFSGHRLAAGLAGLDNLGGDRVSGSGSGEQGGGRGGVRWSGTQEQGPGTPVGSVNSGGGAADGGLSPEQVGKQASKLTET